MPSQEKVSFWRLEKELVLCVFQLKKKDFQYWADRITSINSNTYVPADIRSTVSMLLHQGIKPIITPSLALQGDYLEKTFTNILNKILNSDYMVEKGESYIKERLESLKKSRDLIFKLRDEFSK